MIVIRRRLALKMTNRLPQRGFTVVELVTVIVLVGILSAYVVIKKASQADVTLPSQAQLLAADLRHAQALASTWGKTLMVTMSSTGYNVSCKTTVVAGPGPCNVSPVIDPATNQGFNGTIQKGVSLSVSPTATVLYFDGLGRPVDSAGVLLASDVVYTLTAPSTANQTVTVGATTGRVLYQ